MKKIISLLIILLFSTPLLASEPTVSSIFNVRDFGAQGDGVTNDARAIQDAIDRCTANGGGTVFVPAGTYLTGSIFLKSNVDFYLSEGATLLGSPNKDDYNSVDVCPQNYACESESSFGAHLLLCIEEKNVSVRGPGKIDGNSMKFIVDEEGVPYPSQGTIPWRPSQMLYFVESENIRVQDLELTNAPYWSSFFYGCKHVFIRGLQVSTIRSPHTHNGDGVDVDCCEYVSISDCQINTSDDCITLRASSKHLKNPRPCRYVTISNCVLSTPCNCMRFGVGDGEIGDVVVNNLVIESSRTAFNFVSSWDPAGRGTDIKGIHINNVRVDCTVLFHMYYKYAKETQIEDIDVSNITGTLRPMQNTDCARRDSKEWINNTTQIAELTGNEERPLQNLRFNNIRLDVEPRSVWTASYLKDITMDDVVLRSRDPNVPLKYELNDVVELRYNERVSPLPELESR